MLGLRVVRGPNWQHGDQDGGEDHVGTVVEVNGANSVIVVWDMGCTTVCRGGGGEYDLRVFDGAPVGICHPIACVACEDVAVFGTIWRCATCTNVTLCSPCYHDDKHDISHEFVRLDLPKADPVTVPKRASSQRSRSMGIFPNALVKRGAHWEYGDQDGGSGHEGSVEDIVNFGQDASDRNAARVTWKNRHTHVYRVGYSGKMDLMCTEEAPGLSFYPKHLAVLDIERFAKWSKSGVPLCVGEQVCVTISLSELKQLQQGSWHNRFEEIIGEVGVVESFTSEGDVVVDYEGDVITIHRAALSKVYQYGKGDLVKVIGSKEKVRRLQKNHGGWDDEMNDVLGKTGKVNIVDKDGDIGVVFEDKAFVFNPSCLTMVQASDHDEDDEDESDDEDEGFLVGDALVPLEQGKEDASDDDDDDEGDAGAGLLQMFAGLALLQALADATSESNPRQALVDAIENNQVDDVREILEQQPELKDFKPQGIPLLSIATFKGHDDVIKVLLEEGADIDEEDSKGSTPLLIAMFVGNTSSATLLLQRGANLNVKNQEGRSPVHAAAHKGLPDILKLLLEKGCNPNIQDVVGDTPLHDAICERHDATTSILIEDTRVNVWLQNNKNFNPMHLACLKQYAFAVDKLLTREPGLGSAPKNDGFTPLHIAAFNNHVAEATVLLIKGRVDINARTHEKATPLMLGASQAHFDITKLLLEYEADFDLKDKDGDTALHMCMMGRRTDQVLLNILGLRNLSEDVERIKIANFLYQHGANLEARNNKGQTPITCCQITHIREGVLKYATENKPTKPERHQTRPKTAKVEKEIFTTAKQMCHKCSALEATVRFEPCKHKVSCEKCCFRFKKCPICQKDIRKRVDKNNQPVSSDSCTIL
ncbi:E3 ubiquitin-protein ligase MIB2-like [Mya arenaria]|uniref:E3 ubiquitin-protein ligase MIB2-like n=1 Tax=Mya arenaria TaxID=6604 RepID=UPI0022E90C90|nr:E3 ubiquitin-protein ligase MIB2-like [Mya arenaria]